MLFSFVAALAFGGSNVALAATTTYPARPAVSTIQPALSDIRAAQATTIPSSPTSNVKGKAFDRIIHIWLENTVSLRNVNLRHPFLIVTFRTMTRLLQIQISNG